MPAEEIHPQMSNLLEHAQKSNSVDQLQASLVALHMLGTIALPAAMIAERLEYQRKGSK